MLAKLCTGYVTVEPFREFNGKKTKSCKKLQRIPFLREKTTSFGGISLLAKESEKRETCKEWHIQKNQVGVFFINRIGVLNRYF